MKFQGLPDSILQHISSQLRQDEAMELSRMCKGLRETYPRRVRKTFDEVPATYESFGLWASSRQLEEIDVCVNPRLWNDHVMPQLKRRKIASVKISPLRPDYIAIPPELPEHDELRTGFVDPNEVLATYEGGALFLRKYDGLGTMPELSSEGSIRSLHVTGTFDSFAKLPRSIRAVSLIGACVSAEDASHLSAMELDMLSITESTADTPIESLRADNMEVNVEVLQWVGRIECSNLEVVVSGGPIPEDVGTFPNVKNVTIRGAAEVSQFRTLVDVMKRAFPDPDFLIHVAVDS